jgi:hypothetical protein
LALTAAHWPSTLRENTAWSGEPVARWKIVSVSDASGASSTAWGVENSCT